MQPKLFKVLVGKEIRDDFNDSIQIFSPINNQIIGSIPRIKNKYQIDKICHEAKEAFEKVKELTVKLSMVENAAYRLAASIKKTQKRANALKNITIPKYQDLVSGISNALEEKEREEFTRLKVIKRMQGSKSS